MGEPVNFNLIPLLDDKNRVVDGVYAVQTPTGGTVLTQNLIPHQRFHNHEAFYNVGDKQYRVMNPAESKLAVAICCGLRHLFVKPGTNVLYLAADASSVVTISHLSDIVGREGNVYVAFQHTHDIGNGITVEVLRQRTNVRILEGVDTTNASLCNNWITLFGVTINVIYCDVGRADEIDCMFAHASRIMERGGYFVALIKARRVVYRGRAEIVIPDDTILMTEQSNLEARNFKCVECLTLGRFGSDWCCFAGVFDPLNRLLPINQGSASTSASASAYASAYALVYGDTEMDEADEE